MSDEQEKRRLESEAENIGSGRSAGMRRIRSNRSRGCTCYYGACFPGSFVFPAEDYLLNKID